MTMLPNPLLSLQIILQLQLPKVWQSARLQKMTKLKILITKLKKEQPVYRLRQKLKLQEVAEAVVVMLVLAVNLSAVCQVEQAVALKVVVVDHGSFSR